MLAVRIQNDKSYITLMRVDTGMEEKKNTKMTALDWGILVVCPPAFLVKEGGSAAWGAMKRQYRLIKQI